MSPPLERVIERARCLVVVGPGGVGKTSTSAALALESARRGKRTIVLTIDPAKRLANALGLPEIGNQEREVSLEAFRRVGLPPPQGRLTAMMLDIKEAWDEVVTRYHPDPEKKKALLANRLYVAMSTALAGSQEYMAMEKLHELATRKDDPLDVIVLDTPPANHAVDFLEAPSKLLDALDNDATRWLLEPYHQKGRFTRKLFDAGSSFFIRTISRFTGAELLQELAELLSAFQGMFDGFKERAKAVRAILESPDTVFLVIGSPGNGGALAARGFEERLVERRIDVGAVILNRATGRVFEGDLEPDAPLLTEAVLAAGGDPGLAARLAEEAERTERDARIHEQSAATLGAEVAPCPVVLVPRLPRDIHDLEGLEALRRHLFGEA